MLVDIRGRTEPALRANSFPEVANLSCRLPLLTLMDEARGYSPWRPDADISTAGSTGKGRVQSFSKPWLAPRPLPCTHGGRSYIPPAPSSNDLIPGSGDGFLSLMRALTQDFKRPSLSVCLIQGCYTEETTLPQTSPGGPVTQCTLPS